MTRGSAAAFGSSGGRSWNAFDNGGRFAAAVFGQSAYATMRRRYVASDRVADELDELGIGLVEHGRGTGNLGGAPERAIGAARQQEDRCGHAAVAQPCGQVDAAHARHVDVEDEAGSRRRM